MRALSIRQPFAELILRGLKTIEYRSRSTKIVGERFLIYASKGGASKTRIVDKTTQPATGQITSDNLTPSPPPPWMIELANALKLFPHELPTGVIVGSAIIEKVVQKESWYEWHLTGVQRAAKLIKPKGHPQPVWFRPM